MARAYRCDRCGKLYENNDIRRDDLVLTTLLNCSNHKLYDLCPDCHQELKDWFDDFESELKKRLEGDADDK